MTLAGVRTQTVMETSRVMDIPAKVLSACLFPVADLRWGADASTPPIAQNVLNSMQFFGNFDKIICWPSPRGLAPLLRGVLDPPLVSVVDQVSVNNYYITGISAMNYGVS